MKKWSVFLIIFLFLPLCFSFSQGSLSGLSRHQQERTLRAKKKSPQLYEFEKTLAATQIKIEELLRRYEQAKKTNKKVKLNKIKEEIKFLLKKNTEIRDNLDYQVELMLFHNK
tara:strand:- start:2414 stop:2752 length:339 start_codon:yes stop_codon:yes gene_type:complete